MWSKAQKAAYMRQYQKDNREAIKANNDRYRERNRARLAEKRAKPENRAKARAQTKRWRARLTASEKRDRRLRKLYGITAADFDRMLEAQRHCCAICGDALRPCSTHIDHDHATGRVRGVLCSRCNQGIGLLRESQTILAAAAEYLKPPE